MSPSEEAGGQYRLSWFEAPRNPLGHWAEHIVAGNVESSHHFVGLADFDRGVLVDGDGDFVFVVGEHNLEHPEMARLLLFENLDGRGGRWRVLIIAVNIIRRAFS
jgi:hypothetical protein